MAMHPHQRGVFARTEGSPRMGNFATPQQMPSQIRLPAMLPHAATSAFRPASIPRVPLENSFMPRGNVPSAGPAYHQQLQFVPSRNSGEQVVYGQQPVFQRMPMQHPHKHQHESHFAPDMHPRRLHPNDVAQVEHPARFQTQSVDKRSPEALHQELRMLHVMHYQEKFLREQQIPRRSDYPAADFVQTHTISSKHLEAQRAPADPLHGRQNQLQLSRDQFQPSKDPLQLKREQLQHRELIFRDGHVVDPQNPYKMQTKEVLYRQLEELYSEQRRSMTTGEQLQNTNPSNVPSFNHEPAQGPARYVPMVPISQAQTSRTQEYHGSGSTRHYVNAEEITLEAHNARRFPQPVKHEYADIRNHPSALQLRRQMLMHHPVNENQMQMLKQQQQHNRALHQTVSGRAQHRLVQEPCYKASQEPVKQQMPSGQVANTQTRQPPVDQERRSHPLNARLGRVNQGQIPPRQVGSSLESNRVSQMSLSIKHEQKMLKDELENTIQKASHQSLKKEKDLKCAGMIRNTHAVSYTGHGTNQESDNLPRIVEVRSLANDPTQNKSISSSSEPQNSSHPRHVNTNASDTPPIKPKSLMINAHKESLDNSLTARRVPSRCSVDSESGRKDSWDSGIESPPGPEGLRESNPMLLRRPPSTSRDSAVPLSSPNETQNLKPDSLRRIYKSSSVPVLDSTKQAYLTNIRRTPSLLESNTKFNDKQGIDRCPTANTDINTQLSERAKVTESASLKRRWPHEDHCPLPTKVFTEQAIDYSKPRIGCSSNESEKGTAVSEESLPVNDEPTCNSPLDLTVKREQVQAVPLTKKDETSSSIGQASTKPDIHTQGYFGTVMMRVLQRLWSEKEHGRKMEESKVVKQRNESRKTKVNSVESGDDDSGKYFKPSSATTLEDIPETVDSADSSPERSAEHMSVLRSIESVESLENVICDLMQQSSGAFRHECDIFQHFDAIIKKELVLEVEKQARMQNLANTNGGGNNEATAKADDLPTEKKVATHLENQTNEALAIQRNSSNGSSQASDEMDYSQQLVIAESCLSPNVSPDSQQTRNKADDDVVLLDDDVQEVEERPTSDRAVPVSTRQPKNMYEEAARNAAEKAAARQASQKKGREMSEKSGDDVHRVLSSPCEQDWDLKDIRMPERIEITAGLSPSSSPSSYGLYGRSNGAFDKSNANSFVSSTGSSERMQGNHADAYSSPVKQQYCFVRRFSEPGALCGKDPGLPGVVSSHEAPDGLQRTLNAKETYTSASHHKGLPMSTAGLPMSTVAEELQHYGKPYRKIAPSTWQTSGLEGNRLKIKKVPISSASQTSQPIAVSSQSTTQVRKDMQGQFHNSPIVLLPKIVCVPGQSYDAQQPPFSVAQTSAPRNLFIIKQDLSRYPGSLMSPSTVVQAQPPNPSPSNQAVNLTTNTASAESNHSSSSTSPVTPSSTECVLGPFHMVRKPFKEPPSSKKPCVSAYFISYRGASLPGVVRSGVPFVPPKLLQEGLFPSQTFERFCLSLQECSIMQRYMTVLERAALLPDLRRNKISSCKLVSLEEMHCKLDSIALFFESASKDDLN